MIEELFTLFRVLKKDILAKKLDVLYFENTKDDKKKTVLMKKRNGWYLFNGLDKSVL